MEGGEEKGEENTWHGMLGEVSGKLSAASSVLPLGLLGSRVVVRLAEQTRLPVKPSRQP